MKIVIIEDEKHTAQRLHDLILDFDETIEIVEVLISVESSIKWLKENKHPDLIFQDIKLSDGLCFDIYDAVSVDSAIVFTTAYSEYALKSFELNSIDYLLKPYDKSDLKRVLDKYFKFANMFKLDQNEVRYFLGDGFGVKRERFLVKSGENFTALYSRDIAYFISEDSLTFAYTFGSKRYILDFSLNELENSLDEKSFFRINRNCIVNNQSIQNISAWFSGRLKLQLNPSPENDTIVSRDRVKDFKKWLGG